MIERIEKLYVQSLIDNTSPSIFAKRIISIVKTYWLSEEELEFAKTLYKENKLEGIKWLTEIAKPYSQTPLKDAKEILELY